ncbi:MAG: hypothetical protein ACJAV1_000844 [Paraglaciecola sp.]|jgi:hypothetical protein
MTSSLFSEQKTRLQVIYNGIISISFFIPLIIITTFIFIVCLLLANVVDCVNGDVQAK